MNDKILKMSIITTIQAMTKNYSFEELFGKDYSELESIRDYEVKQYNKRVRGK